MSDTSPTRPPEVDAHARKLADEMIHYADDDTKKLLLELVRSSARVESMAAYAEQRQDAYERRSNERHIAHERRDDERFSDMKVQFITVASAANTGEKAAYRLEGGNQIIKFLGGLVVLIAAIGGAVAFVLSAGKHP